MHIPARDRAVVQLVARFRQASARQIATVLFAGRSGTPCDRTLKRLTEQQYLARIERRIVGGAKGGSGVYVYSLGRKGFYQYFTGAFSVPRNVNYHTIAILDTYIEFVHLARAGRFTIAGLSTEPDSWQRIGGIELRPDLYIELDRDPLPRVKLWLEVDLGSESQKQLRAKFEAYWQAYNDADSSVLPMFPLVVWVAVDKEREIELSWLIEQLPEQQRVLHTVVLAGHIDTLFT